MFSLRKLALLAVCLVIALVFCLTPNANAQQVFGSIFGTVTDANGGVIPNAKVTITDVAKGTAFELTTDAPGNYNKGQLIPDEYRVTIQATGFQKVTSTVTVRVD